MENIIDINTIEQQPEQIQEKINNGNSYFYKQTLYKKILKKFKKINNKQ